MKTGMEDIPVGKTTRCMCAPPSENLKQANTRHWTIFGLMLDQRLRRWLNIKPTLVQRLVFPVFFVFSLCKCAPHPRVWRLETRSYGARTRKHNVLLHHMIKSNTLWISDFWPQSWVTELMGLLASNLLSWERKGRASVRIPIHHMNHSPAVVLMLRHRLRLTLKLHGYISSYAI